jgi:uncharacterized protein (TIGR02453 family)
MQDYCALIAPVLASARVQTRPAIIQGCMPAYFFPATLKFLRGLAKNNNRDWFEARRSIYESELREPMLAFVDAVNHEMLAFAPHYVRDPKKVMMRIYRDTRFAKDKRPYKRQISAWWDRSGMEKLNAGGFYLHVQPDEVMIAAGVYMPDRPQLLVLREWIAEHSVEYETLLRNARRTRVNGVALEPINPNALKRMPKGFAADHPAEQLLRARNWGLRISFPGELALEPRLVKDVVRGFRAMAPVVEALNGAIAAAARPARRGANEWL